MCLLWDCKCFFLSSNNQGSHQLPLPSICPFFKFPLKFCKSTEVVKEYTGWCLDYSIPSFWRTLLCYGCQGGRLGKWDNWGVSFKMDKLRGPTVQHGGACSGLCSSPDGRESRGEWAQAHVCLRPFAGPLKLPQHRQSVIPQYKTKGFLKNTL